MEDTSSNKVRASASRSSSTGIARPLIRFVSPPERLSSSKLSHKSYSHQEWPNYLDSEGSMNTIRATINRASFLLKYSFMNLE